MVEDEKEGDVNDSADDEVESFDEAEEVLEKVITLDASYAFARAASALDYLESKAKAGGDFDNYLAVVDMWVTMGQSLGQEDEETKEVERPRLGFHAELAEIGEPDE